MHRTLEPYHGMVYFAREAGEEYEAVGVPDRAGYFASRSAPMGAVSVEVVIATFFNFYPPFVHEAMDGVWDMVDPSEVIAARFRGADTALRNRLGDAVDGDDIREAAELATITAESCNPAGRPLCAGHLSLAWPDEPHVALWHAISILREFRGDGHIATLVEAGIAPCEALLLHGAMGEIPMAALKTTRAWPDDEWAATAASLRDRGLLDADDTLTPEGTALREGIEARTDELALSSWEPLGEDRCARLRSLVRPHSRAIVEGAGFGF
jgi:hypothetical protein